MSRSVRPEVVILHRKINMGMSKVLCRLKPLTIEVCDPCCENTGLCSRRHHLPLHPYTYIDQAITSAVPQPIREFHHPSQLRTALLPRSSQPSNRQPRRAFVHVHHLNYTVRGAANIVHRRNQGVETHSFDGLWEWRKLPLSVLLP
jgi:hypothetical protein